jgi:hypothetical protein
VRGLQIWIYLSVRRKVQYNIKKIHCGQTTKFQGNYRQAPNTISEQLTTTSPQNNEQFHVTHLPKHSPAVTEKYWDKSPRDDRKKIYRSESGASDKISKKNAL